MPVGWASVTFLIMLKEMYAMDISATEISNITDKIFLPWTNGETSPEVYNILGVNCDRKKELIGVYLSENEGAKFWLFVLMDLKQRSVEDILVAYINGLKGFPEAIETAFPKTQIQLCVVHQTRTSLRYVPKKTRKRLLLTWRLFIKPIIRNGLWETIGVW